MARGQDGESKAVPRDAVASISGPWSCLFGFDMPVASFQQLLYFCLLLLTTTGSDNAAFHAFIDRRSKTWELITYVCASSPYFCQGYNPGFIGQVLSVTQTLLVLASLTKTHHSRGLALIQPRVDAGSAVQLAQRLRRLCLDNVSLFLR